MTFLDGLLVGSLGSRMMTWVTQWAHGSQDYLLAMFVCSFRYVSTVIRGELSQSLSFNSISVRKFTELSPQSRTFQIVLSQQLEPRLRKLSFYSDFFIASGHSSQISVVRGVAASRLGFRISVFICTFIWLVYHKWRGFQISVFILISFG